MTGKVLEKNDVSLADLTIMVRPLPLQFPPA
jgi:hypothetical protein